MKTFNSQNRLNPLAHSFVESSGQLLLEDSERAQTESGGKTKTVHMVSLGYASSRFLVTREITRIKSLVGPSQNMLSERKNYMLENILLGTRTE